MAASSLSSLFIHPHRYPNATTTSTAGNILPPRTLSFSTKATPPQQQNTSIPPPPPGPQQDKKSFSVATGELFLGIASRILIRGGGKLINEGEGRDVPAVEMFAEEEGEWWWRGKRKERIATVVEDPVQPEVVWEQRVKDVEAEQRRKVVTSPGFSFSAAGLLFPYHLGVANFLIEKGYIKAI